MLIGQIVAGFICFIVLFIMGVTNFGLYFKGNLDFLGIVYLISVCISLIPAIIAYKKGRNLIIWWIYGFFLFLIAMIHSLLLKPNEQSMVDDGMKKCPFCAEMIKPDAKVCRYCGRDLPEEKDKMPKSLSPYQKGN